MSIFATGNPLDKLTKVVPVFLAINNDYAPYAAAAIHSLTEKCDKNRYYRVIILHDGLSLISRIRLRSLVTKNVALQFKKITNSRKILFFFSKSTSALVKIYSKSL